MVSLTLQYYNRVQDDWGDLKPFRASSLSAAVRYRVMLHTTRHDVYWELRNPENFHESFMQDLESFSYWIGYNGGGWIQELDHDAYVAGAQDRDGDKVLLNKYIDRYQ